MQEIIQFPGEARAAEAHKAPGQTLLALRRATVDLMSDGTAENERITEEAGFTGASVHPITLLDHYKPAAATMPIEVLLATSYAAVR